MIFFPLLLIISIISFFITRNSDFPAYLISLPIILFLTKERYCLPRSFKTINHKLLFTLDVNGMKKYIIIGILIFLQVHLPQNFSFETFEVGRFPVHKFPGSFQAVVIYVSFIALTLIEYCNEKIKFTTRYNENEFHKVIGQILIVNPMILLMAVGLFFFAYEVAREVILWNIVCSYNDFYCPS
jgi:hypothetical protein